MLTRGTTTTMNGVKTNGYHPHKASGSKAKQRPVIHSGTIQADTIKDVADSMGMQALSDTIASTLASDLEYRLNQVIEEATRYMKHAKRTTLTIRDVDLALRMLNIEPLYGHSARLPVAFRKAVPQHASVTNPIYAVDDDEIDLERVVREKRVKVPREVGVKPHWLAVEGVQPAVPENPPIPPSIPEKVEADVEDPTAAPALPLPLQLYNSKFLSSVVSSDPDHRTAALASLSSDAGLQLLVPNLVNWIGDRIVKELQKGEEGRPNLIYLEAALGMVAAMLKNEGIFLEPYLHQLLPPLLSLLLVSPHPHPPIRREAASTINMLVSRHSAKYTTLASRLLKTFLRALLDPEKALGTRAGAVRGLASLGIEGVRRGLIDSVGCRVIGLECEAAPKAEKGRETLTEIVQAVQDALHLLSPDKQRVAEDMSEMDGFPSDRSSNQDTSPLTGPELSSLTSVFGSYFSNLIAQRPAWARGLLAAVDGGDDGKSSAENGQDEDMEEM